MKFKKIFLLFSPVYRRLKEYIEPKLDIADSRLKLIEDELKKVSDSRLKLIEDELKKLFLIEGLILKEFFILKMEKMPY